MHQLSIICVLFGDFLCLPIWLQYCHPLCCILRDPDLRIIEIEEDQCHCQHGTAKTDHLTYSIAFFLWQLYLFLFHRSYKSACFVDTDTSQQQDQSDQHRLLEPVYHDGICQIVDQTFLYRFSIHLCRSRIDRDLIEPHRRSCLRRVRRYPHCQSLRTTGKLHKQELICFHIYKWSNSLTDLLLPVVCTDRQLAFYKLMFIYCKEKSNLTGCLRRHVHLKYQLMSLCQFFCC